MSALPPPSLVLASTSVYRRDLLSRFGLAFETVSPATDESPLAGEHPAATAERLAHAKAAAVAGRFEHALVIGSDQVAYSGAKIFGKPGIRPAAIAQLREMSGNSVMFHTGLCLMNTRTGVAQVKGVATEVRFRHLTDDEIERYIDREPDALNCAGSAKSEGLGISLLLSLRGDDPTALIGLPLLALAEMLRREGIALP
jgi:septum formation protein